MMSSSDEKKDWKVCEDCGNKTWKVSFHANEPYSIACALCGGSAFVIQSQAITDMAQEILDDAPHGGPESLISPVTQDIGASPPHPIDELADMHNRLVARVKLTESRLLELRASHKSRIMAIEKSILEMEENFALNHNTSAEHVDGCVGEIVARLVALEKQTELLTQGLEDLGKTVEIGQHMHIKPALNDPLPPDPRAAGIEKARVELIDAAQDYAAYVEMQGLLNVPHRTRLLLAVDNLGKAEAPPDDYAPDHTDFPGQPKPIDAFTKELLSNQHLMGKKGGKI